jgi:hypothetical protein
MSILNRLEKIERRSKPDVPHRRVIVWFSNIETLSEARARELVLEGEDVAIIEMEMVESKT